ncbi:MAG TPA: DEAD/DEAH box helicase, partial [Candidatus Saccharimonadia bacterium]|nr:DEAD/DEAH box helicase [Candidatus Saccharimonadia bacterium]
MTGTLAYELAGERVVLDAARALYWPRTGTLFVADVHFGKAQLFRRAGIPIPRGSTSSDLARLDALIARHEPRRLVVLGDLVHGPSSLADEWLARVRAWRASHRAIGMLVVRGN